MQIQSCICFTATPFFFTKDLKEYIMSYVKSTYTKGQHKMQDRNLKYIMFILIQSLIYGFGNPLTKTAYETITPLWLIALRFTISAVLFVFVFRKQIFTDTLWLKSPVWLPSALCCAGAYITCNIALDITTATNVGFIMSMPVLFAPLLQSLVLRRKYELKKLPVQLAAVGGLFLLCCNGGLFAFGTGEILAVLDALCLAGVLVFTEKALNKMNVFQITAAQMGVTMIVSVIPAFVFDNPAVPAGADVNAWLVIIYLAVVCTIGGYLLQNIAVTHLASSAVAMLQCTQPILTALASFLLLGETLTGAGLAGGGIIIAALTTDGIISRH